MAPIKGLLGAEVKLGNYDGYVAQIDRDHGITIKDTDDDSDLFCLNKEQIIKRSEMKDTVKQYHEAFSCIMEQIQKGEITHDAIFPSDEYWFPMEVKEAMKLSSRRFSCPFS